MTPWTPEQSEELYNVFNWASGFFSINPDGNVEVTPDGRDGAAIDLHALTEQLRRRGVALPILVRFDGILRARVRQLNAAFNNARREFDYRAPFRGVYPIKVNQERHVVEALLEEGNAYGMGLEVGSKPELIAGIAIQAGGEALLICNGYKDREYVEMAILASQLGIEAVIVIEKFTELATVLEASKHLGIRPTLGVRSKLSFKGSGRWQDSVGDRSKFGLTSREIVQVLETLREEQMLDCLQLLHFHIGSQITEIRSLKRAMREATRIYAGLTEMGAQMRWFDVGGGLGVDYEGTSTSLESSRNYSLQEYANDVVWSLKECCEGSGIKQPIIVTESGRALSAHHAVLVGEVVGVSSFDPDEQIAEGEQDSEDSGIVQDLRELCARLTPENYLESFHDTQELREKAMQLFEMGQLNLPGRAQVEEYYWRARRAVLAITRELEYVPEELNLLERDLSDTYFVNLSIFQSMPDAWAIQQLFPILPLHRHTEEPRRRAVLADLTCDSDGKIDQFVGRRGAKSTLELHDVSWRQPYYLGFFLVGAYQEILGDMHNLFGDTNVVHVDVDGSGKVRLRHVLRGDRVKEVLSYVEYFEDDLLRSLRRHVEDALEAGRMSYEESALFWKRYEDGLRGYTYLQRDAAKSPSPTPLSPEIQDSLS